MTFEGRVAIVTGGTRGIGAAVTRRLVEEGAHVTAVYLSNHDSAKAFADDLADGPGSVTVHALDVGDRAGCRELVEQVVATHGRLDHVVNNAGLLVENSFSKLSGDEWEDALRINLTAPFHLSQAAVDVMIPGQYGRIVHVGSITAMMGNRAEAAYGAAKAGLVGLTRSMAQSLARKGITVNLVVPGVFETEMMAGMREETKAAILAMIPMGRRGDPAECAHAVMYLLDDRASYVTGSVVTVDGGISMGD